MGRITPFLTCPQGNLHYTGDLHHINPRYDTISDIDSGLTWCNGIYSPQILNLAFPTGPDISAGTSGHTINNIHRTGLPQRRTGLFLVPDVQTHSLCTIFGSDLATEHQVRQF